MTRPNVPPGQAANLANIVVKPRALLELQYSVTLRLTTGWPVPNTWNGYTWLPGGFELELYEQNGNGEQSAEVTIAHSLEVLGTLENEGLFRLEGFDGQRCSLWKFDEDTSEVTPLLINGFVDDGQIGDLSSRVDMVGPISNRIRAPRATFAAPAFNNNLPAPARVTWQNEVLRLEVED